MMDDDEDDENEGRISAQISMFICQETQNDPIRPSKDKKIRDCYKIMVVTVFYPQQNYFGNLLVYVCNILFSARATFQICLCLSQLLP